MKIAIEAEADEENKLRLKLELEKHQRKAEKGYATLPEDREKAQKSWNHKNRLPNTSSPCFSVDATDMYTFDFEQNLPLPTLTHSDGFYARQLWVYNFGVHDCVDNTGIKNMWDESTAKRGSCEVVSCLQSLLEDRQTGAQRLILFSDGCCGQNKNWVMVAFLLRLIEQIYRSIDHKFLVRGHTFLPNDRDFSCIEARKKVEMAYVPSDWVKIVQEARAKNPFIVNHCSQDFFVNHKQSSSCIKTRFTDQTGQTLFFRDVVWFSYGESEAYSCESGCLEKVAHKEESWCRYTYSAMEPWKKIKCMKRGANSVIYQSCYN